MTDTYIIDLLYQDQAKGQEAVKQVYQIERKTPSF